MPSSPQEQTEVRKEEVKAEENENKKEEAKKDKKKREKTKEKKESWKDFIYNPGTREFLGRTASSWGKTRGKETGVCRDERVSQITDRFWPGPARSSCFWEL